jgi:hypothetical protein
MVMVMVMVMVGPWSRACHGTRADGAALDERCEPENCIVNFRLTISVRQLTVDG